MVEHGEKEKEVRRAGGSLAAGLLLIGLTWLGLLIARQTAPPNLMEIGFERTASYAEDILQNGNWLCQHDLYGNIESKPPLFFWLVALFSMPLGGVSPFTACLPGALSTLAVSLIVLSIGRGYFGLHAGLLGALMYLLSPVGAVQMGYFRTDAFFVLPVTGAAMAAFGAWKRGGGWMWFWLLAAAATLTKGPLGLLMAATGLLAILWERRSGKTFPVRGRHWPGIVLFLLLTAGWFALALAQEGWPLIARQIQKELFGQGVGGATKNFPGQTFYLPLLYFLGRFAPWSALTCVGLWRAWRRPSPIDWERRLERFLLCWLAVWLAIFSLAVNQQPRHLFPIFPAAALLAGRELAYLLSAVPQKIFTTALAVASVVVILVVAYLDHVLHVRHPEYRMTEDMRQMADAIRKEVGEGFPFTHAHTPFALRYYLRDFWQDASYGRAAALLREHAGSKTSVFVLARDPERLLNALLDKNTVYELKTRPGQGKSCVKLLSNRPRLEWTDCMAAAIGSLVIRMEGVRLTHAARNKFRFERRGASGAVTLTNFADEAQEAFIGVEGKSAGAWRRLNPRESWKVQFNGDIRR